MTLGWYDFKFQALKLPQTMKQSVDVIGVGAHTNNLTIL
jgi:hypothetical protein